MLEGARLDRRLLVGIAGFSALMTVFVIFIFPLWAIAVLTVDFLIIYALLTQREQVTG